LAIVYRKSLFLILLLQAVRLDADLMMALKFKFMEIYSKKSAY